MILGSHDDATAAARETWRGLGARIAEFPTTREAADAAQDAGDAANVHEWFRAFCEMHASGSGGPEARAKATAKARGAGNAKGRRARAELDERGGGARASEEEDAAPETNGLPNAEDDETKNGKETFSLEKRRLWELQARFTRAAAELEFLGVARPVKRRKVEYMQRTAFPLDQLLGEDGL